MSEAREIYYQNLKASYEYGGMTDRITNYVNELEQLLKDSIIDKDELKFENMKLEQQNKWLRELLDDVIAVLVCHEQSYNSEWLKDYQDVYSRYEQIIT